MKLLITGGAGFIGSNFIKYLFKKYNDVNVINLDVLNYSGREENLEEINGNPNYRFVRGDICDVDKLEEIIGNFDIIVNFAAETHVDRSVTGPLKFINPNIMGVTKLLEFSRKKKANLFIQISTDEVYGDIINGFANEKSILSPNNPYAASKAAAEMMVKSYIKTYKVPAIITRSCNNYGPNQYPEKIIPFFIIQALNNKNLPLHGDGSHIRDWLFVQDNCEAIDLIINKGKIMETYNIARNDERTNLEIAKCLLNKLGKPLDLINLVEDRPWNDIRYAVDVSKVRELGWKPKYDFNNGIDITLDWYKSHKSEMERLLKLDSRHPMINYMGWL
ncbi:MAG: dTDP-glucose 4,6-dehydratase [archaeon GW2011_AR20]|nr:MAG: dTDP-glucose 4,6-dehydratase [archaeon GW2011_AR20]AQS28197.1 hypothetical protein [uncultured archaeon]MBS3160509.1 dTDP-glucose 4,6-dehydratase [Candidatus Woesearchaeota archaeon]